MFVSPSSRTKKKRVKREMERASSFSHPFFNFVQLFGSDPFLKKAHIANTLFSKTCVCFLDPMDMKWTSTIATSPQNSVLLISRDHCLKSQL